MVVEAPDQSLPVVSGCHDVALAVRSPRYLVHLGLVVLQGLDGLHWIAHVQDLHVVGVLLYGGEVEHVLLVPGHAQQRLLLRALIDNGTMLEVSKVKVAHGAVLATGRKHLLVSEADVVDGTVVGYQLGLDALAVDVPDRARCIDGARADDVRLLGVPVKRSDGCAVVGVDL